MKVNVELNREELATVQESLLILSAIAAAKDETATQYLSLIHILTLPTTMLV